MSAPPLLDDRQHGELLRIGEAAIAGVLRTGRHRPLDTATVDDPTLLPPGAAFVTLLRPDSACGDTTRVERLLGCVGTLRADAPLAVAVDRYAVLAAFSDPRLPAITRTEFATMTLKVSVLSAPEPLDADSVTDVARHVRPGIDGLVLDAPGHSSTFLPSVWEQLPDVDAFLAALWRKALLTPGAWPRGTRVERYTTDEFASYGPRTLVPD